MRKKKSQKTERNPVAGSGYPGMSNGKFTFRCRIPFSHNGEKISSITIRRATVADAIAAESFGEDSGFHSKNTHYFSLLSGHSPDALKKMDYSDWLKFLKEAGNFLGMGGLS